MTQFIKIVNQVIVFHFVAFSPFHSTYIHFALLFSNPSTEFFAYECSCPLMDFDFDTVNFFSQGKD